MKDWVMLYLYKRNKREHGIIKTVGSQEIEELFDMQGAKDEFLPAGLAVKMAELTGKINREIAVYINRKGNIIDVSVGDSSTVSLPEVEGRKDLARLVGVRCIHTHPNGEGMVSLVDLNSLVKMRLDAMVAVGVKDGRITEIYAALPVRMKTGIWAKPPCMDLWQGRQKNE